MQPKSLNVILWSIFAAVTLITQNWYNFSAVLPILQPLWNLTATQTGLIVAAFQLGYVISVLICSFFSDTHSPQKIFILGGLGRRICTGRKNRFDCFSAGATW